MELTVSGMISVVGWFSGAGAGLLWLGFSKSLATVHTEWLTLFLTGGLIVATSTIGTTIALAGNLSRKSLSLVTTAHD